VQNAAPLGGHLDRAQLRVVENVALAGQGIEREAQIPDADLTDLEVDAPRRDAGALG
jgi:hypothetical protein